MSDYKTVNVTEDVKGELDELKLEIFNTDSVSYNELIQHLIEEHRES